MAGPEGNLPSIGAFLRVAHGGEEARSSASAVAALMVGIAADLAMQVARSSTEWNERGGALAQAEALRGRALALATELEHGYEIALAELSRALDRSRAEDQSREGELGGALGRVLDALLRLGEVASDTGGLAEVVARSAPSGARPEAVAATMLAASAADVCAHLVEVNLLVGPDDERSRLAHAWLADAERSREAARALPR